jgi:hypothetical protein
MTKRLLQLLINMTQEERSEVEIFAAFVIVRRNIQTPLAIKDDISSQELMQLIESSGSFDWLDAEEEDVYSLEDGKAICFGTLINESMYSHTGI